MSPTVRNWLIVGGVIVLLLVVGRWREKRARAPKKVVPDRGSGFDSVAGCDEAVDDLRELVEFLRDPVKFERLGATPPKGALLVGPPGTGKTLLARAVAAEASVPFIAASATDFVEMYVGVGAKRVRELYESARSHKAAIVFIDEIDAVARARSMNDRENGTPGGPIEHENTLIALLTELDGFNKSNIITIAATNRADVLDKAILRPGRLERRIEVPLPDRKGRHAILKVHASSKPLATDVDLDAIAARTAGMSGADLARVCNEAALEAVKLERSDIDQACFSAAVEFVALGRPRRSMTINESDRRITAWHEAGHAICGFVQEDAADPVAVTVVPRGPAAGVTWFENDDRIFLTKEAAFAQLVVALGGRVAEEKLMGGSCTQGAASDLARATELATQMATTYGMSGSLMSRRPSMVSGPDAWTQDSVASILDEAHAAARTILTEHIGALEAMADALMVEERLDLERIESIVGGRPRRRIARREVTSKAVEPVAIPTRQPARRFRPRVKALATLMRRRQRA
ncbi:MAG: ATP-dependent metallopeptidase FtsH/Yme1/Tma family protein [Ilumatobacteraceae bacterium]